MKILTMSSCLLLVFFSATMLSASKYSPTQLEQFSKTNKCISCDLSNSWLDYGQILNHSNADLEGSNLSNVETNCGLNLSEANLENTNMTNIDFSCDVNLSQANLENTALFGANLAGANLYNAKITAQQLSEAKNLCNAILPDGSKGKCNA